MTMVLALSVKEVQSWGNTVMLHRLLLEAERQEKQGVVGGWWGM